MVSICVTRWRRESVTLRVRGCTETPEYRELRELVLPACAGMYRSLTPTRTSKVPITRVCGDVPFDLCLWVLVPLLPALAGIDMKTLIELNDAPETEPIPLVRAVYDFAVGGFVPEHPEGTL
jgi:hypothetical protein